MLGKRAGRVSQDKRGLKVATVGQVKAERLPKRGFVGRFLLLVMSATWYQQAAREGEMGAMGAKEGLDILAHQGSPVVEPAT
jgi:hypothetical protein